MGRTSSPLADRQDHGSGPGSRELNTKYTKSTKTFRYCENKSLESRPLPVLVDGHFGSGGLVARCGRCQANARFLYSRRRSTLRVILRLLAGRHHDWPRRGETNQPGARPREPKNLPERALKGRHKDGSPGQPCVALSGLGSGWATESRGGAPGCYVSAPSGQRSAQSGPEPGGVGREVSSFFPCFRVKKSRKGINDKERHPAAGFLYRANSRPSPGPRRRSAGRAWQTPSVMVI